MYVEKEEEIERDIVRTLLFLIHHLLLFFRLKNKKNVLAFVGPTSFIKDVSLNQIPAYIIYRAL